MEVVQPKNLMKILAGAMAGCDCMCRADQYAGAQSAGKNSGVCGCYCAQYQDSTLYSQTRNYNTIWAE